MEIEMHSTDNLEKTLKKTAWAPFIGGTIIGGTISYFTESPLPIVYGASIGATGTFLIASVAAIYHMSKTDKKNN